MAKNLPGDVYMARKKILNNKILKIINHYLESLKTDGVKVEELILFGSHAKGTAKSWSDIDLAVVSKDFGKDSQSELVNLLNTRDKVSIDIEPHPFNPKDLLAKWDPLAHEIRKYGIVI